MYNDARAQQPIDFIQLLHLTGDFHGKQFLLQEWQKEVIRSVYGTIKDNGFRQYRMGYLEIPKKNGKTNLIAALGIYHIVCDPPGGEIYCCAAEKVQAGISYRAAKEMIEQEPELSKMLKVVDSLKEIHNKQTGTFLKVLSADAYSKHGLNPSIIIFDELHAQPNRELWDTMSFGASSTRQQPLLWCITTSGDDPDRKSVAWEQHEIARNIIDGTLTDPTVYAKIYGAPEDADIYDEAVWYAANPSLGVTIDIDYFRNAALKARNSASSEKLFRWLHLNQWISLKRLGWLPITLWDDTEAKWHRDSLKGKRCYVGLDLSTRIDLCDVVPIFPPQTGINDWRFFLDSFCPADNIAERSATDHVDYVKWEKEGYLHATPGNVVDYSYIKRHIEYLEKNYQVQYYCGDPWHLEILKQLLSDEIQRKIIEIPQTMSGMSTGMGELERLFRAKEISHDHDPLGRWSFGNVIIATDGNNNQKPVKNKSIERIDPIVALINAVNGAIKLEPKRSVYESRGIRMI